MEYLEIKIIVCKVKNTMDGINGRLDISEEKISKSENKTIMNYPEWITERKGNIKKVKT